MDIFSDYHKNFLFDLASTNVQFIIIGGYAVNFHGYPRFTNDMDLWINDELENILNFADFLKEQNFDNNSIEQIKQLDTTKVNAFHIGEENAKIDFLTKIKGLEFKVCYKQANQLPLKSAIIRLLHLDDLIVSKMMSDRLQDKADVEALQNIKRKKM